MEKIYESLDIAEDRYNQPIGSKADGQDNEELLQEFNESATRASLESMKSGELLAEALIVWEMEKTSHEKFERVLSNNYLT